MTTTIGCVQHVARSRGGRSPAYAEIMRRVPMRIWCCSTVSVRGCHAARPLSQAFAARGVLPARFAVSHERIVTEALRDDGECRFWHSIRFLTGTIGRRWSVFACTRSSCCGITYAHRATSADDDSDGVAGTGAMTRRVRRDRGRTATRSKTLCPYVRKFGDRFAESALTDTRGFGARVGVVFVGGSG